MFTEPCVESVAWVVKRRFLFCKSDLEGVQQGLSRFGPASSCFVWLLQWLGRPRIIKVIFEKRARVFHLVSKHQETDESMT